MTCMYCTCTTVFTCTCTCATVFTCRCTCTTVSTCTCTCTCPTVFTCTCTCTTVSTYTCTTVSTCTCLSFFSPLIFSLSWIYLSFSLLFPFLHPSRWIRLLFGREFHLPSVLQLWDALFAEGTSLALMDYVFITMLMQIRETC